MATTRELLLDQKKGAEILHNGAPVRYEPRWDRDQKPWVHSDGRTRSRYSAAQCQAVFPTTDTDCLLGGEVFPEHDFPDVGYECRRCGAEVDA